MNKNVLWILACLLSASILHIVAVLGMPWLAEKDAFSRLSAIFPANRMTIEPAGEGSALPFSSPDVLHAYCPFDVSERDLVVTSLLPYAAWSLTVSTRRGENFYVITGADVKKAAVRLLIVPKKRLAQETATDKTEEGEDQNIIVTPSTVGIIAIQAPLRGESFRAQTARILQRAHCELQKSFEPVVASVAPIEDNTTAQEDAVNQPKHRRKRHRR